jgi:hypothetical protein
MVIPEVERKSLDFYELKEMIAKLGGSEQISKDRSWPQLALEMGYAKQENGYVLKRHYEKYLEPFLTYINQEKSDIKSNKNLILGKSKEMLHQIVTICESSGIARTWNPYLSNPPTAWRICCDFPAKLSCRIQSGIQFG